MNLKNELKKLIEHTEATTPYRFGNIEVTAQPIRGVTLGYATKFNKGALLITGKIVIDSRYLAWGDEKPEQAAYVLQTLKHELCHLIAETKNKGSKGIYHGQAWKDIYISLGGDGKRFNTSGFEKPENVGKVITPMRDLYKIKPTQPAANWEKGTFRQWLERGYHVMRGQKGHTVVWDFVADEYETSQDGKTSRWGRAAAVYFTPDQVEPNK